MLAGRFSFLALAELDPSDLAAGGLWQLFYELYLARVLVGGGLALAVVLDLPYQLVGRIVVGGEDHVRLHHAPPFFVGHGHDGALGDCRVANEDILDLERTDAVAGGEDHVVRPTDEPDVSVLVLSSPVSGQVVVAKHDLLGLLRLLPVPLHERGVVTREGNIPRLARRELLPVLVDYAHVAARRRLTHRARPDLDPGEVADEEGVLRLAVAVVDREPVQLLPPLHDRRVQGLPGRKRVPDARQIRTSELGGVREHPVFGRGLAENRDPVTTYEIQAFRRVEGCFVHEELRPPAPGAQKDVPHCLGPAARGRTPESIVLL